MFSYPRHRVNAAFRQVSQLASQVQNVVHFEFHFDVPAMPPITAMLHTTNDALRLPRTLETLLPCAEILIVDHGSTDRTLQVARRYGARIASAADLNASGSFLRLPVSGWILCLQPGESLTEMLQATLFEWNSPTALVSKIAFSVTVLEQTDIIWRQQATPETRLVPKNWARWNGYLPAHDLSSSVLEGDLLRLAFP